MKGEREGRREGGREGETGIRTYGWWMDGWMDK